MGSVYDQNVYDQTVYDQTVYQKKMMLYNISTTGSFRKVLKVFLNLEE